MPRDVRGRHRRGRRRLTPPKWHRGGGGPAEKGRSEARCQHRGSDCRSGWGPAGRALPGHISRRTGAGGPEEWQGFAGAAPDHDGAPDEERDPVERHPRCAQLEDRHDDLHSGHDPGGRGGQPTVPPLAAKSSASGGSPRSGGWPAPAGAHSPQQGACAGACARRSERGLPRSGAGTARQRRRRAPPRWRRQSRPGGASSRLRSSIARPASHGLRRTPPFRGPAGEDVTGATAAEHGLDVLPPVMWHADDDLPPAR